MTVARLKQVLGVAIIIGERIAQLTETKVDDNAVALAKKLETNEVVLAFVAALFAGEPNQLANLSPDDRALVSEVMANKVGLLALVAAADPVVR
jgi:hypothetical protein